MPRPHRRAFAQRGFTLVELLVVVAIISVLASLAILGYRKYINAAQSSEAKVVIGQIRAGEEQFRAETLRYLSCSSSLADYYPNATPDDTRWSWVQNNTRYTSTTTGWSMLNVHPDGPVRYGYAVMAGIYGTDAYPSTGPGFSTAPTLGAIARGMPWYVIQARNKRPTGNAHMLLTTSFDGSIYMENEGN